LKQPKSGVKPRGADQPKLPDESVDHETKPGFLGKLEACLGFSLHVDERITRGEKVRDQVVAAIAREHKVAACIRDLEGATDHIAAGAHMFGPRHDEIAENLIGASFEALQPTLFNQVVAELAEPKAGSVVAERGPAMAAPSAT